MFRNDLITLADVLLPSGTFRETTTNVIREAAADAPSILGIGLETLTGVALGGGGLGLAIGGYKLAKVLLSKNRKGGSTVTKVQASPFPRKLDEARQQRELAYRVEGRVPEYDAAVGRIVDDELALRIKTGSEEEVKVLNSFWLGVRGRVDRLMPPSVREYISGD